jgi:hypothetical protein
MAFQIDEDSPVALALTPRPVINTDRLDAGYRHGWPSVILRSTVSGLVFMPSRPERREPASPPNT